MHNAGIRNHRNCAMLLTLPGNTVGRARRKNRGLENTGVRAFCARRWHMEPPQLLNAANAAWQYCRTCTAQEPWARQHRRASVLRTTLAYGKKKALHRSGHIATTAHLLEAITLRAHAGRVSLRENALPAPSCGIISLPSSVLQSVRLRRCLLAAGCWLLVAGCCGGASSGERG